MSEERTIVDVLARRAAEHPDLPALLEPRPSAAGSYAYDAWDTFTWRDYHQAVRRVARAFLALGFAPGDAVGIIGPNRAPWVLADLAAIAAGGMPTGIYATATPEQVEYILGHAGAALCVVVDTVQAAKVLALAPRLPRLKKVILFPRAEKPAGAEQVLTWEELLAEAERVPEARLEELRAGVKADDLATLIYTSGTTGPPKAVALTHKNLTWTGGISRELVGGGQVGERAVSYLPLAHIAEQVATIHAPITAGITVHFVPVMEQLGDALRQVRPHYLFAVPRVWEKIQARVEGGVSTAPPSKQRLFRLAQRVGLPVNRARFAGERPPLVESLAYPLFDRLVFGKLRDRLGLGHARVLVTGAAPLSVATRDWMLSLGLPISEVYGQSEDTGPTSFNAFGAGRLGTVGKPIPGVEVRIAEDGEICVRGPNVFAGYYKDEGATREALVDGWLRSGDVGQLDADGFLKITDRKKDLIITAGGKNIAPQNIERLLREIPLVSQAVVIGERAKFLTALLTLVPEKLEAFARERGLSGEGLAAHPVVRAHLEQQLDERVNPRLAQYETIKRFTVLPAELSEAQGELTPTMKIKRKAVATRYAAEIAAMYAGADA